MKVAINGFGRIGRCVARALFEYPEFQDIELVAINAMGSLEVNALLLEYDSVHGKFAQSVSVDGSNLLIGEKKIAVFSTRNPQELPWQELGVDYVFECTGALTSKHTAGGHLEAGAKKVLISAPGKEDIDATIVFGVNHKTLKATDTVISNASCTTNCLAPLVQILHNNFGIKSGLMTTIHAYTNDQKILDVYHQDPRRARAAGLSQIPTKSGAAAAIGLIIPELKGKLDGFAIRVPTANVSLVDLTVESLKSTTEAEVKNTFKQASQSENYKGILGYNDKPLVSSDFNHSPYSAIFESSYCRVIDKQIKVLAWYDNEWAFSVRMLDLALHHHSLG